MKYTLYVAEFPHGKKYFGITSGPLAARIRGHKTRANCGSPFPFHAALRKYGDEVQFKALFEGDRETILQMEIDSICEGKTQDRHFGYNVTPGGDDSPAKTPEVAEKISAAQRGKKRKPRSEAAKAKTSASLRNAYAEGRRTRRSGMEGREHTAETRERMKAAQAAIGRKLSEAQKAAISKFHTGRKHSDETKRKRSESIRRYWDNEDARSEHGAKISAYWNNNLDARAALGVKISAGIAANGGRIRTVCKQGHELSGDNVYLRRDGRRQCRVCDKIRNAHWNRVYSERRLENKQLDMPREE